MSEDNDRGEFGMPGLGEGTGNMMDDLRAAMPMTKPYLCTRVPFGPPSATAKRIVAVEGPLEFAVGLFFERNREYGDEAHVLGIKGQYADINRKVIKLKRYLWDDVPVEDGAESVKVVAAELIGHLLLLIDELEHQS